MIGKKSTGKKSARRVSRRALKMKKMKSKLEISIAERTSPRPLSDLCRNVLCENFLEARPAVTVGGLAEMCEFDEYVPQLGELARINLVDLFEHMQVREYPFILNEHTMHGTMAKA